MRLNRFLSQCGLGSRRGSEQLIREGRVSVNGHPVKELATQVAESDQVTVDGRPVRAETGIVIALHKPRGYICTRSDERDRMTIYDLLPKQLQNLHHVGRLDKESEGLILMTNRGDLSHRLSHPSQGAEKEYEVIVDKALDQTVMAKMVKGMLTEEGHAKAERAWMITEYRAHVVLKQGLKRQIRLMFYQLGYEVERLTRTRIGWLELRRLPRGGWKELSQTEVERFFSKEGGGRPAPKVVKSRPAGAAELPAKTVRPRKPAGRDAKPFREGRAPREGTRKPADRDAKPFREGRAPREGTRKPADRDAKPFREGRSSREGTRKPAGRDAKPFREGRAPREGTRKPAGRDAKPFREGRAPREGTRKPSGRSDRPSKPSKPGAKRPPATKRARRGR